MGHGRGCRRLAIRHQDGFIRLWDVQSLKPTLALDARWYACYPDGKMTFSKDGRKLGPLQSVAYSPNGDLGAAGSEDWRIVVWDVDE